MKFSWEHLAATAASVLVILLSWFAGPVFHLTGWDRGILSGGILVIGAAIIGGFLLWTRSNPLPKPAPVQIPKVEVNPAAAVPFSVPGLGQDDVRFLIREAESKVASARLGHGAKLSDLRVLVFLGETGSGKTTAVLNSGLDPEFLAGHVFQEGAVAPTRVANFWFARKSVLIEAGPSLLAEPRLWLRLIYSLTPRGLRSVMGWRTQGERSAVVCVDCEKFIKPDSADALAGLSRFLRARLEEMSRILGSGFPFYVIFTGADRIPFFGDFVATMSTEEGAQVFGATLPIATDSATSIYTDRESRRLTTAYNSLYYSLADHRPPLLSREGNPEKQPGVYEFPREFSKLNKQIVQFLVDLGRPSQLRAGAFLRGFYFTGLRTVESVAASAGMTETRISPLGQLSSFGNATSILRQEDVAAMRGWQSGTQIEGSGSRKVIQSVFLSHIFGNILLQDRGALIARGASARVSFWRRTLLATTAILGIIWIIGSLVSFRSNRILESNFSRAAQGGYFVKLSSDQPASPELLQQLETLRKSLEELTLYERTGVPLHLRWGLYLGHDYYVEARRVYFLRFRQLLFDQIQASMADVLRRLPRAPGPNDEYIPNYDTLKAYLITTSNPDKSTPEFLSPVLDKHWIAGRNLDANSQALARIQFDFYADELKLENPYSSDADAQARDHARDYLNHFGAVPRIYAAMQKAAALQNQPFNFYRAHLDGADLIRSVPEIPGAFVKGGWDFMQNAITHSDQYFRGEEWVLGSESESITNRAALETQLRSLYLTEFIKRWQDFLKLAIPVHPGGTEDAIRKLKKYSANESPVLALLCDASLNTTGRSADVDKAFKPVQQVAPYPGCENRVPQITIPYVAGLAELENCLENPPPVTPDQKDAQPQTCGSTASKAKLVVKSQIMPSVPTDAAAHLDQTIDDLLEAPISVPVPPPPTILVTGVKELCAGFAPLTMKFPFNPSLDAPDASIQDFDNFLEPSGGALQKFVRANQSILVAQGAQIALKPGTKLDPALFAFLNKARFLQVSLYSGSGSGPAQLQYKFNVRATLPEGGISAVTFSLNGQSLKYPGGAQSSAFVWPGNGSQGASISYQVGGGQDINLASPQGPWAIVRLLSLPGTQVSAANSALSAEWHPLQPDRRSPLTLTGSGKPIVVHLEFENEGAPFVLQGGYFSNLSCRTTR